MVHGSRVWVNGTFKGRFEVFVFGGKNTLFSWSQMALVAPLERIEGGVDGLVLEAGTGGKGVGGGNSTGVPVSNAAARADGISIWVLLGMSCAMAMVLL